jgi:hypothetical protein
MSDAPGRPATGPEQWFAALADLPPPTKGPILVVCFRKRLWIEWAIYSACHLYRMGYQPTILYSQQEVSAAYGCPDGRGPGEPDDRWAQITRLPIFRFVDLDRYLPTGPTAGADLDRLADRHAPLVVAHDRRCEAVVDGQDSAWNAEVAAAARILRQYAAACDRALRELQAPRAICPSGIIGWSGMFREMARALAMPTVFVEMWRIRPGHMTWSLNRPAVDHDLRRWLASLEPWDETKESEVREIMRCREMGGRAEGGWLRDFHSAQRSDVHAGLPENVQRFLERPGPHVLAGPNVIGDSATLGRATIFESQRAWLESTCRFFLDHPDLNLIVRAHPDEAAWSARQSQYLRTGTVAESVARGAANILVVHGHESMNTYALASRVQGGLAWTSTFAVDMVSRGKPVVVAARAPYLQLGIGTPAASQDEYFHALSRVGEWNAPSAEMVHMSKVYQWILLRKLSLLATTVERKPHFYRLDPPGSRPEQERFYRILAGELDDLGRAPA